LLIPASFAFEIRAFRPAALEARGFGLRIAFFFASNF